eukprot:CAMPEP_0172930326 /NCGR_PEP_ID=MMETSP1075-20121228/218933_1 /TAXON_ID=2916 /ORGANISM="Ceratium fusus, Strain PA161109" /LENGTH=288 /DNA_ID=CAMNT_0013791635 /DNA_START=303 /DNA_END=1173 /DNA_ORIENTATION=-
MPPSSYKFKLQEFGQSFLSKMPQLGIVNSMSSTIQGGKMTGSTSTLPSGKGINSPHGPSMLFFAELCPSCPLAASTLYHHGSAQITPCTARDAVGPLDNQRSCGVSHLGGHKSMAWTKALAGTSPRATSALSPAAVAPRAPLNTCVVYLHLQRGAYVVHAGRRHPLLLLLLLLALAPSAESVHTKAICSLAASTNSASAEAPRRPNAAGPSPLGGEHRLRLEAHVTANKSMSSALQAHVTVKKSTASASCMETSSVWTWIVSCCGADIWVWMWMWTQVLIWIETWPPF